MTFCRLPISVEVRLTCKTQDLTLYVVLPDKVASVGCFGSAPAAVAPTRTAAA